MYSNKKVELSRSAALTDPYCEFLSCPVIFGFVNGETWDKARQIEDGEVDWKGTTLEHQNCSLPLWQTYK